MEFEAQSQNPTNTEHLNTKYQQHMKDKTETKSERDKDRKDVKNNTKTAVVCFDMQNVLTCPRANVSSFFYKRKLNVYNLTAHSSVNKTAYNAMWAESMAGRGGNEICSALLAILHNVTDDCPNIERIILWSDSCVPQNRNSIMTFGLKKFLFEHPGLKANVVHQGILLFRRLITYTATSKKHYVYQKFIVQLV